jgi:hypothetical protein
MRTEKMKKNPRYEDIYTILRERIDPEKSRVGMQVLQKIVECEMQGTNVLLFFDKGEKKGGKIYVTPNPEGEGLIPIRSLYVWLMDSEEDWSTLSEVTAECKEVRILKTSSTVMIECNSPTIDPQEMIGFILKMKKPVVECYYEPWE